MFVIGMAVAGVVILLQSTFELKEKFIRLLGREPDLTSRTPIWDMLLNLAPRPWTGAGYESFWSGPRMSDIWMKMGTGSTGIIQAHNGYIDIYLNLGIIGLALLLGGIAVGAWKAFQQIETDYANGVLRILIVLVAVIYNYTEAAFKPLSNVFVLLLFALVKVTVSTGKIRRSTAGGPRMRSSTGTPRQSAISRINGARPFREKYAQIARRHLSR